jgi:alkylation response protein AidB-like acyl-CoA dehydrogenase
LLNLLTGRLLHDAKLYVCLSACTGRLLRDAKLYEIGAGTTEIRKLLIGRELLKEV